jgi:hypothetical protein
MASREERERRRAERAARIAARRQRAQARRERVQARREAAAARRAEAGSLAARGLRKVEHIATDIGVPPKQVASTLFGDPINLEFVRINAVESSWVSHVMLLVDQTTGRRVLGVRFLDGYACWYSASSEADYHAMMAAPSKGKHIWSHWYGMGKRKITAATGRQLRAAPGTVRQQGRRRRVFSG